MNSENINKWLSLCANVGVVIGLLLLIYELDQNSDLIRSEIHQMRADAQVAILENRADAEFLVPALEKLRNAGGFRDMSAMDELNEVEAARVKWYLRSRFTDYDNMFYQYQQGYLDEEAYQASVVSGIKLFGPWWRKHGDLGPNRRPSFVAEIDRVLSLE